MGQNVSATGIGGEILSDVGVVTFTFGAAGRIPKCRPATDRDHC
jgi:hypothetical protein